MAIKPEQRLDYLTPEERSERMRRIRSKDTKPEFKVRRCVHSMGYRYRLHSKILPGHPDLIFASRKKVIFIHGCFWHQHEGCSICHIPKTRHEYWVPKLQRNKERDKINQAKLKELGWRVLVIWECEVKNIDSLKKRLLKFLGQ